MRLLLFMLAALLLPAAAHAQLNGTYTVGGVSPNYATISAAVADLNALGISGPVFFQIRSGTYDEQVTITDFTRSGDPTDAVTFTRPSELDPRPVWQSSAAGIVNNWVVRLDGADYVILQGIAFEAVNAVDGRLVVFESEATYNTVRNSTLEGILGAANDRGSLAWADGTANDGNVFEGNTFTYGYIGIDFDEDMTPWSDGTVVQDNTFSAQTEGGVHSYGSDTVFDDNTISSWAASSATYRGIESWGGGAAITRNVVDLSVGDIGIWLGSTSSPNRLMANNVVSLRSNGTAAIYLAYGDVNVYHNTAVLAQGATTASALYIVDAATTNDVVLANNVLLDYAGGYALRAPGGQVASSDYNVLYASDGSTFLGFAGLGYSTLAAFQTASGLDAHSISEAVTFVDPPPGTPDLHLSGASLDDLALIGTPVGVTTDMDNHARDAYNPKRGADEGTPLPPLDDADTASGFYAVAGAAPEFVSPQEAFDHLAVRGMKGAVTFRIRAGTFLLHSALHEDVRVGFAATDPAATPFIVRAANPNNRPLLRHAATGAADNYLLRLEGLDYVALEKLRFEATGTALHGRLLVLQDGVEHLTVDDNAFTGLTGVDTDIASLVFSGNSKDQFGTFSNNAFVAGARGIDLGGVSVADPSDGNVFTGNTCTNQWKHGLYLQRQLNAVVADNVAESGLNSGGYVGIYASGPGLVVQRNEVDASLSGTRGISIGPGNDANNRRRVVNNMVLITGDGVESGIHLADYDYVDVYHNTVLVDGTFGLTTPTALRVEAGALGIDVRNNLLINRGLGTAYVIEDDAAVTRADYNNLRTNGATLAHWDGTDYATLSALRVAAAPDELHAQAEPITFANPASDLHLGGVSVGNGALAGEPLASVTDDLDEEARSATAPYMGADEAAVPLTVPSYVLAATSTSSLSVAGGGSIAFSYAVTNHTAAAATGDLYFTATGGTDGLIRSGSLPAGQTLTATYNQQVPGNTPPGVYSYTLHIGNYPNQSVDSVPFQITVTPAPRQAGAADAWVVTEATPWVPIDAAPVAVVVAPATVEAPVAASATRPAVYALHAAAPNPFAGRTTLRFDVPAATAVTVEVLDLLGRRVAVLLDGEVEAGAHAVPFEASALPSGVYLVRMTAADFTAIQRITRLR